MNDDEFESWLVEKVITLSELDALLSKSELDPRRISTVTCEEDPARAIEQQRTPEHYATADKLRPILQDICTIYLGGTSTQRESIRHLFNDNQRVGFQLRAYQSYVSTLIRSSQDLQWLLLGLAAVSLEDRRIDYRDTYPVLADLYVQATHSGIDPGPYFRQVGLLSTEKRNLFGGISVQELFSAFEDKTSGLFKQLIEPRLS